MVECAGQALEKEVPDDAMVLPSSTILPPAPSALAEFKPAVKALPVMPIVGPIPLNITAST